MIEATTELGSLTHLRAGGVSVVLDTRDEGVPVVLHWGVDLGETSPEILEDLALAARGPVTDSKLDVPDRPTLIPTAAEGWVGSPELFGSRGGRDFSPLFKLVDRRRSSRASRARTAAGTPDGTSRRAST
jgi:alpha-galactosidase